MNHITLEPDETYHIVKVKKTDNRLSKIHLSPPMTPTLTRKRILQNKILELEKLRDRYIFRYRKKRFALRLQTHSDFRIDYKDMTEEERTLMKEFYEPLRVRKGVELE